MMMQRILIGALAVYACSAWGALEFYGEFEGKNGAVTRLAEGSGRKGFGSVRLAEGGRLELVSEVADALRGRSKSALAFSGKALLWYRSGADFKLEPDFSLSFFWQPDPKGGRRQTLVARSGSWSLDYLAPAREIQFAVRGGKPLSCKLPAGNAWRHLAVVRRGSEVMLYCDGAKVASGKLDKTPVDTGNLYLGASSSTAGNGFSGKLDEVTLWSHALDEAAVAGLAAGKSPREFNRVPGRLTRTVSKAFPAELAARPRAAVLNLDQAVIGYQPDGRQQELAKLVQERFRREWGVELPLRPVRNHHDGREPLILFGARNADMLWRELVANQQLRPAGTGAEFRVIPEFLDWRRGVVALVGRDAAELNRSMDAFFQRYPKPGELKAVYYQEKAPDYPAPAALWQTMQERYAGRSARQINLALLGEIRQAALAYRDTGNPEYAAVFGRMTRLMLERYEEKLPLSRYAPPTFEFHEYPQYCELLESEPAWTAAARRDSAELMRRVNEHTMNYYEMATPAAMYAEGRVGYLTNHYNFAARMTYNVTRYLLDRYDFAPARFWQAVALHVFDGVKDHPFSPEDAGGYQYLVYRIFSDHALSSGRYGLDFFKRPQYREYVDFTKATINHLGYTPGYGDANATGMASGYTLLKEAVDILGDEEAEYFLTLIARRSGVAFYQQVIEDMNLRRDLPPPSRPELRGLNTFTLDADRQKLCRYPQFPLPVLNKAVFRSGFGADADFLAVNGLAGAPHGHDDPTGISQYIHGDRLWIFEGDYIKRFAEEHNMVQIVRNGLNHDRRRNRFGQSSAAQIAATLQTPDRRTALLSLVLADYNGAELRRHIGWEGEGGFVVVDEITAAQPGDYLLFNQWRTTGDVTAAPQGITVEQKGEKLAIAEGSGAARGIYSRLETCHGRPQTVLAGYGFSDRKTRTLQQRHQATLRNGEKRFFINFLRPLAAGEALPEVRQLAPGAALILAGGTPRLAVAGKFAAPGLELDADFAYFGANGFVVAGGRQLKIDGKALPTGNLAEQYGKSLTQKRLGEILGGLTAAAHPAAEFTALAVPETSPYARLEQPAAVSAEAVTKDRVAVGLANGLFRLYDWAGKLVFERRFDREISLIAPVADCGAVRYLVGIRGVRKHSILETSDGEIVALDAAGRELWRKTLPAFARRYGDAVAAVAARLDGREAPPSLVIGVEAQRYFALDLNGKERFAYQGPHGATAATVAGDLNGDGFDEVFCGNEYYYHDIIDRNGKQLRRRTTSPWDLHALIADLNGDGRNEVLAARSDGFLYAEALGENPLDNRVANLGGKPVGLVRTADGVAAAAMSGVVTWIDSELKQIKRQTLPASLSGLAQGADGQLYTACYDGMVYRLEADKGVTGRLALGYRPGALRPPTVLAAGDTVAAVSGNQVLLFR